MGSEIIAGLVGLFCTTVSSIVTFILTKRKYNTEVDAQQIQNMKDSFEVYKNAMEEALAAQKQRLEDTISSQNDKIEYLQKENDNLRTQVGELQMQLIKFLGNDYKATPKSAKK